MNARELLDVLDSSGYIEFSNAVLSREHYRQNLELLKSALRLQADAESNDGTVCKLVEDLRTEADLCRNETATDIAELLDDAASSIIAISAQFNAIKDERNGLAARVAELEKDAERLDWMIDDYRIIDLYHAIGVSDRKDKAACRAAIDAARSKP